MYFNGRNPEETFTCPCCLLFFFQFSISVVEILLSRLNVEYRIVCTKHEENGRHRWEKSISLRFLTDFCTFFLSFDSAITLVIWQQLYFMQIFYRRRLMWHLWAKIYLYRVLCRGEWTFGDIFYYREGLADSVQPLDCFLTYFIIINNYP